VDEDKVVFKGKSEKGSDILIRYPSKNDAQAMCDYINALSREQTFVRFQGEEISLEFESKYLEEQLQKIKDKKTVQLLVFCESKLIGISGIDMKDKTESHEGVFGVSLADKYRGEGIGKKLMQLTFDEAVKNIPQLGIVTLGVFGKNFLAIDMYKKFGFKEFGRLPNGVFRKGEYDDHVYMYKKVKED